MRIPSIPNLFGMPNVGATIGFAPPVPSAPAWVLNAGDGAVTIIEMPAVAAPVAVAGDGQITIEEYA